MTTVAFESADNYNGSGMTMQEYIVANSGGAVGFGDFGGDPLTSDGGLVG